MSKVFDDEFHGVGGSYEVRDGKRVRVDEPQQHHPDGDRARDPDGNALDQPEAIAPALPVPAQEAAADAAGSSRRRARSAE